MKTSTRLNEVERKYIVAGLLYIAKQASSDREVELVARLAKKINSGIRYDRQNAQSLGKNNKNNP